MPGLFVGSGRGLILRDNQRNMCVYFISSSKNKNEV